MRLPGTRLLFEGFYKVRFQLNDTVGRSVMYARGGKMLGGNSAFAHIGTYEKIGDEIAIEIKTVRHNPDPNYRAMAGTDDATLLARGRPDGMVKGSGDGWQSAPHTFKILPHRHVIAACAERETPAPVVGPPRGARRGLDDRTGTGQAAQIQPIEH